MYVCRPDVSRWQKVVEASFSKHVLPPAALGSGAEKTQDKAAAVFHQFWMECGQSVWAFLQQCCVSCTSDMGIELRLVLRNAQEPFYPSTLTSPTPSLPPKREDADKGKGLRRLNNLVKVRRAISSRRKATLRKDEGSVWSC